MPGFQIINHRPKRNAGSDEHGDSAEDVRIGMNGRLFSLGSLLHIYSRLYSIGAEGDSLTCVASFSHRLSRAFSDRGTLAESDCRRREKLRARNGHTDLIRLRRFSIRIAFHPLEATTPVRLSPHSPHSPFSFQSHP